MEKKDLTWNRLTELDILLRDTSLRGDASENRKPGCENECQQEAHCASRSCEDIPDSMPTTTRSGLANLLGSQLLGNTLRGDAPMLCSVVSVAQCIFSSSSTHSSQVRKFFRHRSHTRHVAEFRLLFTVHITIQSIMIITDSIEKGKSETCLCDVEYSDPVLETTPNTCCRWMSVELASVPCYVSS